MIISQFLVKFSNCNRQVLGYLGRISYESLAAELLQKNKPHKNCIYKVIYTTSPYWCVYYSLIFSVIKYFSVYYTCCVYAPYTEEYIIINYLFCLLNLIHFCQFLSVVCFGSRLKFWWFVNILVNIMCFLLISV